MAHMVWYWAGPDAYTDAAAAEAAGATAGYLFQHGALDFAGGTVVHINAAVAGLVGAFMVGKRVGYGRDPMTPHSLTMTMIGAALLWFGWFGFNAGSSLEANGTAALAFANTWIAPAAAALSWTFAEWAMKGRCDPGVGEGQGRRAVGFEGGTSVEAEPAEPQQGGTDHGHGQAVGGHGVTAIANPFAHHEGPNQTGHRGVDVHHGAAGEVQSAVLEQIACGGTGRFGGGRIRVGIRTRPVPHHVRHRDIGEGEPYPTTTTSSRTSLSSCIFTLTIVCVPTSTSWSL
jgi:hypothetical protein